MCLYSYHKYFILSQKSEKSVTERKKRLNLQSLFIDEGNHFLIPPNWIIEITSARSYAWFLNLLACYSRYVLPKYSKTTVTWPNSRKEKIGSILTCPKLVKWVSVLNCSVWKLTYLHHGEARNIKFGQYVSINERVPLRTSPQELVMSLFCNHVTNLFISSCRWATVIKFEQ